MMYVYELGYKAMNHVNMYHFANNVTKQNISLCMAQYTSR
jgi:hypothetical protein